MIFVCERDMALITELLKELQAAIDERTRIRKHKPASKKKMIAAQDRLNNAQKALLDKWDELKQKDEPYAWYAPFIYPKKLPR